MVKAARDAIRYDMIRSAHRSTPRTCSSPASFAQSGYFTLYTYTARTGTIQLNEFDAESVLCCDRTAQMKPLYS
jgi:hypothetical protein